MPVLPQGAGFYHIRAKKIWYFLCPCSIVVFFFMWYLMFLKICSENALAHQACVLRADLEKSQKDNASLFLKIGMPYHCLLSKKYLFVWEVQISVFFTYIHFQLERRN